MSESVWDLPGVLVLGWDDEKRQCTLLLREPMNLLVEMPDGKICNPNGCGKLIGEKIGGR